MYSKLNLLMPFLNSLAKVVIFFSLFSSIHGANLEIHHEERLTKIFNYLKKTTHPKLNSNKLKLEFYRIDNPNYFMESNFHVFKRVILRQKKYRIGVNPIIFSKNIPDDALLAVMAHELVHTEDYEDKKIIRVAMKLLRKKSKRRYERSTDLRVVFKGFGYHLIQYKNWQYHQLSKKALKKKKKEYLTPEEITFVLDCLEQLNDQQREHLKALWLKKTPLNLEGFKASFSSFLNN